MSDIAQLAPAFEALQTELNQVQARQGNTPGATPEWWALQRQIADLRQRKNEAEVELLEARIANAKGNALLVQSCENKLYFLRQELRKPRALRA